MQKTGRRLQKKNYLCKLIAFSVNINECDV
jgi:hypothetical protein